MTYANAMAITAVILCAPALGALVWANDWSMGRKATPERAKYAAMVCALPIVAGVAAAWLGAAGI